MKYSIIKHNKNGKYSDVYDAYIKNVWIHTINKYCEYTTDHLDADFSILPIAWEPDYEYDELINNINFKNIIVLDFMEYGCGDIQHVNYNKTHLLYGIKFDEINNCLSRDPRFKELHINIMQYLQDKIRLYFKRELSSKIDLSNLNTKVLPCDYTNIYDEYDPVSSNEFYNRGLDLLYIWGRSNQDRVKLHGSIFQQMDRFGHNMYTSEKQYDIELIDNKRTNAFLLLHREWYERCDFKKYQFNSKTVIDLYGAGMKCFRNIESSINCVPFKQDPSLQKHAYEWIDGYNCIFLPNLDNGSNQLDIAESCNIIEKYTRGDLHNKLYDIYLKSCEINHQYIADKYIKNYFLKHVNENIK